MAVAKPRVSGLDSTGLRLVKTGRTVTTPAGVEGLVTRTYGPRCWVKWGGSNVAVNEFCKDVTVWTRSSSF